MTIKKKIINGSIVDIVGTVISTIVSFLVIRLYFQVITKEEFGLWLAINGAASLISLVDLGIDQYFTTIIARDETFLSKTFNTELSNTIVVKLLITTFFLIVGLLMVLFLDKIIDISPNMLKVSKITFGINTLYLIGSIFFNSGNSILLGRQHFSLVNLSIVITSISSSILTFVFLKLNYGLTAFPLSLLICGIAQFIFLATTIKNKYPHIRFGRVDLKGRKEMLSYSFSFQLLRWSYIIRNQYIIIALNNYSGAGLVATYNITSKIPIMMPGYFSKIVSPFFPSFSNYVQDGNYEALKKIVIKITRLLFRFSIFMGISLCVFNESFISLWVGADKYAGLSAEIFIVINMVALSAFAGFGIIIYSTKKFEKWTLLSVLEIFFVILLGYLGHLKWGFNGVIAGFVLGSLPTQFYVAIIALRQAGINIWIFLKSISGYVLIPNIISLIIGFLIHLLIKMDTWAILIITGFIFCLSHFILFEGWKFLRSNESGLKAKLVSSFSL